MKESQSGTRYNVTAPFLVESYQAANNCYTSGEGLSIASPIYKMQGDSGESKIFPYRQIIRGDGGCYLNAALVGILNRCVNDQKKWQQFKENVISNYSFAKEIIEGIETRAINKKDDDSTENGLDRAKLNEILQEKGNDNLATQLSKKIITHLHQKWINEYDNKISQYTEKLSQNIASSARINNIKHFLNLSKKYKDFLTKAQENEFAEQYEESVLKEITKKLIDKTGIPEIYTIDQKMMSYINNNTDQAENLGLLDNSTIYLFNPSRIHFDICYGINDPIIKDLDLEKDRETLQREAKKVADEKKRQELLENINAIISQQQEGKASDEQGQIANIINDILQETELNDATLAQLSLINDIYEASKEENSQSRKAAREATIKRKETKTHDTEGGKTYFGNIQEKIDNYDKLCFELAINEIMTEEQPTDVFSEYLKVLTPNNTIESKRSLAHIAAMKGKKSFINSLLNDLPSSFGAKEECTDNTPLMWAIANANNEFAYDLLEKVSNNSSIPFIDIDHISLKFSNTALHLAVAKGYEDMDSNSKPTIRSNLELVSKLIECGSNPNILTDNGLSALDIAVMRGDIEMVQSILTSPTITAQTIDNACNIANQKMSADDINDKLKLVCGGEAGRVFKEVTQDDIKADKINKIKEALKEKLNEKFPQFKQEQEDKRIANIIITKQAKIYSDFFDQNGVIKQDKKDNLKKHIDEGIDWWVFPGYTMSDDPEKNTATQEVYDILSNNPRYCQKYKTFIYQYIAAFDDETKITHGIRFNKLVESLIGMTANNTRTLAGFTQKEQDLLFIAVQNFKDRIGYQCQDTNYNTYFNDLSQIVDESKEVSHHSWLVDARAKLRDRLKLQPGKTDSNQIQAKPDDYQPIFANRDNLNKSQIDDFNKRLQPYDADQHNIGCGTFQRERSGKSVKYPFVHFRLTHDPISIRDNKDKRITDKLIRISDKEYLQYPPVAAICIDYPDYRSSDKLPNQENLKIEYKQRTLETLILYNELKVDHLVKHGDGMGVFLKQKPGGERSQHDIKIAMSAYLDGFFEAVREFYNQNPSATLQKITCPILDEDLERSFKEKLAQFKKNNSDIGKKITPDKAGPRFNITKYYIQGAQKLGMTIAPHKNHEFLGGVLDRGNVLEEQISALTDIASIGNSKFNKNVNTIVDMSQSQITQTDHTPQTPSTTVEITSNFKKEDYVTTSVATEGKIFYHKNGHNNGKRITCLGNIAQNENQRKAGAYYHSTKETHEVLNDILQSVIDAAKEAGISDITTLENILTNATKKGTVKDDQSADSNVKKFSALFQENCKNKNIFSAQDYKTGLRTKRFGDVFGGVEGIKKTINNHIEYSSTQFTLKPITATATQLTTSNNLSRT
jgi:hypothetical protein